MTSLTSQTETPHATLNGIDVAALRANIDAVRRAPEKGRTSWRVRSTWQGGARSDHHVSEFSIAGRVVPREFTICSDEPVELGGTNRHANPQEILMASLNACMMFGYAAVAGLMGITLNRLEVELRGDIDTRGFLGIDAGIPAGYGGLTQVVRLAGDATEAQFTRLHEVVRATSPNLYNITRAIPVDSKLIIETEPRGH